MNVLENKINEFRRFYDTRNGYYQSALEFFMNIIAPIKGVDQVSGRVKDYDECVSKFKRKYLPGISPENTSYKISDYLSDFIGIRVVCFYLEDVQVIVRELRKNFLEINITDKTLQLEKTDDKFGYRSLHLDLALNKKGRKNSEGSKYYNVHFELQIRTIIQDAWSVLDHKIKYKKNIPQSLKRRINRLSALFEIADDEFLRIRKEIDLEEKRINDRIKRGAIVEKNKPLDVFGFLFIALKHFPDYNFIEFKVDGFVQEILALNEGLTESDLNESLVKYLNKTEKIAKNEERGLNPFTRIRYCLYLYNPGKFATILSDYQKQTIVRSF